MEREATEAEDRSHDDSVRAPMTGRILEVGVAHGDEVTEGQPVAVLEAMKMEYRLVAPRDGVVASVHCEVGELVELGSVLVVLGE
jgi:3-methylcrotonyl-CoA carboxylase alpha subunit